MTAIPGAPGTAGRRERKKQQTREALVDAAFRLFREKGFEATTVEEIADAVDVSSRTFFRYFASKEDVVLTFQEEQFAIVAQRLAARPAAEPVLTAVRNATLEMVRDCEQGRAGLDLARFGCIRKLMESSPAVFARSLEHAQKKQAGITRIVAARMGVDPETDLRPHAVAAVLGGVFSTAARLSGQGVFSDRKLSDILTELFDSLQGGLNHPAT